MISSRKKRLTDSTCSSEGSSESCSPICTGWSAAITCLNCLLQNGQENLSQSAVQQVVWNLESSCSDLGFNVFSATISATPTTTYVLFSILYLIPQTSLSLQTFSGFWREPRLWFRCSPSPLSSLTSVDHSPHPQDQVRSRSQRVKRQKFHIQA